MTIFTIDLGVIPQSGLVRLSLDHRGETLTFDLVDRDRIEAARAALMDGVEMARRKYLLAGGSQFANPGALTEALDLLSRYAATAREELLGVAGAAPLHDIATELAEDVFDQLIDGLQLTAGTPSWLPVGLLLLPARDGRTLQQYLDGLAAVRCRQTWVDPDGPLCEEPTFDHPIRVVGVHDPQLLLGDHEVESLARIENLEVTRHTSIAELSDDPCAALAATMYSSPSYDFAHLACHLEESGRTVWSDEVRFEDHTNPGQNCLVTLVDLRAACRTLEANGAAACDVVVANVCKAASPAKFGAFRALLGSEPGALVGPIAPVDDRTAAPWAVDFYSAVVATGSVIEAVAAAADAGLLAGRLDALWYSTLGIS